MNDENISFAWILFIIKHNSNPNLPFKLVKNVGSGYLYIFLES